MLSRNKFAEGLGRINNPANKKAILNEVKDFVTARKDKILGTAQNYILRCLLAGLIISDRCHRKAHCSVRLDDCYFLPF